jgi:hypothetical protein
MSPLLAEAWLLAVVPQIVNEFIEIVRVVFGTLIFYIYPSHKVIGVIVVALAGLQDPQLNLCGHLVVLVEILIAEIISILLRCS